MTEVRWVGTHVQVWDNPEVGSLMGVVTADHGTGNLVVEFPAPIDDERVIPVERIHVVSTSVSYRSTRSGVGLSLNTPPLLGSMDAAAYEGRFGHPLAPLTEEAV